MLDLILSAHVGLYRDPKTLAPAAHHLKLPDSIGDRLVVAADSRLVTGHSALAATRRIKDAGATGIEFVCPLAAPEDLEVLSQAHRDAPAFTAPIDRELKEHGYVCPGLAAISLARRRVLRAWRASAARGGAAVRCYRCAARAPTRSNRR